MRSATRQNFYAFLPLPRGVQSHGFPRASGAIPRCLAMVWPISAKLARRPKLPGSAPGEQLRIGGPKMSQ
jgi:hypothetical protein